MTVWLRAAHNLNTLLTLPVHTLRNATIPRCTHFKAFAGRRYFFASDAVFLIVKGMLFFPFLFIITVGDIISQTYE